MVKLSVLWRNTTYSISPSIHMFLVSSNLSTLHVILFVTGKFSFSQAKVHTWPLREILQDVLQSECGMNKTQNYYSELLQKIGQAAHYLEANWSWSSGKSPVSKQFNSETYCLSMWQSLLCWRFSAEAGWYWGGNLSRWFSRFVPTLILCFFYII